MRNKIIKFLNAFDIVTESISEVGQIFKDATGILVRYATHNGGSVHSIHLDQPIIDILSDTDIEDIHSKNVELSIEADKILQLRLWEEVKGDIPKAEFSLLMGLLGELSIISPDRLEQVLPLAPTTMLQNLYIVLQAEMTRRGPVKIEYELILTDAGEFVESVVDYIKELRTVREKDIPHIMSHLPQTIASNITGKEAIQIKQEFEKLGALVELQ